MQIQIRLTEHTLVPVWFLGDPGNLKVSLNYKEPGPVLLDFTLLTSPEQKSLLGALQKGVIETEAEFNDLYSIYVDQQSPPPALPEPSEEVKEYLDKVEEHKKVEQQQKAQKKQVKIEQKFAEKCEFLHKKSLRALKSALKGTPDTRLLQTLLRMEKNRKKPRVGHLKYLTEKLGKVHEQINLKIANTTPVDPRLVQRKETMSFDVVELDQEEVTVDLDDLDDLF
jgi:hypothetical protein